MKNYTVKINHENREIVISKELARKASVYKSEEYQYILDLKKENSGYSVSTRPTPNKRSTGTSKLTLNKMKAYISKHDADGSIMVMFEAMTNEEAGDKLYRTSFFAIKKWFFEQYPELKNIA